MLKSKARFEEQLAEDLALLSDDPDAYMDYAYEWGKGELEGEPGPRKWQKEINQIIRDHLQNPDTRFQPLMIAVASGHGIGKSAEIGMLLNWGMSTAEDCKGVITANTEPQMRTKTFPEIGKWFRRSITRKLFEVTATSVHATDPSHEKTWRTDAVTWTVNNTEAFAGLHNKKKRIIVVFDEASAIDDKVWEVTEGALTDEETEIIWIVFGNPTRNTGRFRECFRKYKHRWVHRQIDSRTVEGTNKAQIQKWLEDHGEDSDFFKIRVRGEFPNMSARQFISTEDADAAFGRHLRPEQYSFAPKIIGVDPAWTGSDEFIIWLRQGLMSKMLGKYPFNDNDLQMATIIANFEDQEQADAVFVDLGFGTGIVSAGKSWGRDWKLVNFGAASDNPGYHLKRSEMWGAMKQWLKDGGAIPPDPQLKDELTAPETIGRSDGKIQLESKDDMKARGIPSPNRADALAITFAYPVLPKNRNAKRQAQSIKKDWNPIYRE